MTNKNLVVLAGAAIVLAGAAYVLNRDARPAAPKLVGKDVVAAFDPSAVASIEIGSLKLAASDDGWKIASFQDYPADKAKIIENLLKLQELKVGQVAHGRDLKDPLTVALKDASGKDLATLALGEKRMRKGANPMYGGYPDGRYVKFGDAVVLVNDALDAFDGDPKRWCDTQIVETPYVNFTGLAEAGLSEDELGFATGTVCRVTVKGDTNRVATVGGTVKSGTDRYLKLDNDKWVYTIPSYSADSLVKAAEEAAKKDAPAESEAAPAKDESGAKAAEPAAAPAKIESEAKAAESEAAPAK